MPNRRYGYDNCDAADLIAGSIIRAGYNALVKGNPGGGSPHCTVVTDAPVRLVRDLEDLYDEDDD